MAVMRLSDASLIAPVALLLVWLPVATAGPGESQLTVAVPADAITVLNPDVLTDGQRLPPEIVQLHLELSVNVLIPGPTACPTGEIRLEFKRQVVPAYATATLSASQVVLPYINEDNQKTGVNPAPQTVGPFKTQVTISTTRDAPAFSSGEYGFAAKAYPTAKQADGCGLAESPWTPLSTTVGNDYLPLLSYQPAKYVMKSGPNREVGFGVRMINHGNGQTKIATELEAVGVPLDAMIPPALITLDSKAMSATAVNSDDALLTVRTPMKNGYTNSLYSFRATFTATAVQGSVATIQKDVQSIAFSVQVQGVYVPGFDVASGLGSLAVGLMAIGLGRRRP